ncbi:alpha/beta hydrolase [Phanerochaete sordida]|uniref:Alpha/beta hydrolase n=1 Tax=Phanerochaete sordida TaxID=48140 RepID=A0A9P3GCY2_9APHY|nr:alpha/beta hydrolase [Phanerochaete sordida]
MIASRYLGLLAFLLASVLSSAFGSPLSNALPPGYLNPTLYKNTVTSRGLTYQYYHVPPSNSSKPTLLLCHGYPSFSQDWRRAAPLFEARGYRVLAVDMLGYHGTARPLDPKKYLMSAVARDLVDVVDAEKLTNVVAIGHDWGSLAVSRLSNYFPERFLAYAFLAVQFLPPEVPANFSAVLAAQQAQYGYELYGYWLFYAEHDANAIIQAHMDSYVSIIYPSDPIFWKERMAPAGALKKNLLADFRAPRPSYISAVEVEYFKAYYRANGFSAPDGWYTIQTTNLQAFDDQQIPADRAYPPVTKPIFYGGVSKDYIARTDAALEIFNGPGFAGHNVTLKEYDSDHWVLISHAEDLVRDLDAWLEDAGIV